MSTIVTLHSKRRPSVRYELRVRLGSGSCGEVWLALLRRGTERPVECAVKLFLASRQRHGERRSDREYKTELAALETLRCDPTERSADNDGAYEHVVQLLDHEELIEVPAQVVNARSHSVDPVVQCRLLALPFYGRYTLMHLLQCGALRESVARRLFRQLVAAIQFFHRRFVFSRDIKPENIVLDAAYNIVVIDLSHSLIAAPNEGGPGAVSSTRIMGTRGRRPPEMEEALWRERLAHRQRRQPDERRFMVEKADVYACGMVLYNMLTGCMPPWSDSGSLDAHGTAEFPLHSNSLFARFCGGEPGFILDHYGSWPYGASVPGGRYGPAGDLLLRMLHYNPEKRASMSDVAGSVFLAAEDPESRDASFCRRYMEDHLSRQFQHDPNHGVPPIGVKPALAAGETVLSRNQPLRNTGTEESARMAVYQSSTGRTRSRRGGQSTAAAARAVACQAVPAMLADACREAGGNHEGSFSAAEAGESIEARAARLLSEQAAHAFARADDAARAVRGAQGRAPAVGETGRASPVVIQQNHSPSQEGEVETSIPTATKSQRAPSGAMRPTSKPTRRQPQLAESWWDWTSGWMEHLIRPWVGWFPVPHPLHMHEEVSSSEESESLESQEDEEGGVELEADTGGDLWEAGEDMDAGEATKSIGSARPNAATAGVRPEKRQPHSEEPQFRFLNTDDDEPLRSIAAVQAESAPDQLPKACRHSARHTQRMLLRWIGDQSRRTRATPTTGAAGAGEAGEAETDDTASLASRHTFLQYLANTQPHALVPTRPSQALQLAAAGLALLVSPDPRASDIETAATGAVEEEESRCRQSSTSSTSSFSKTPLEAARHLGLDAPRLAARRSAEMADRDRGEGPALDRSSRLGQFFHDIDAQQLLQAAPGVIVLRISRLWLLGDTHMRVWVECVPCDERIASSLGPDDPADRSLRVRVPMEVIVHSVLEPESSSAGDDDAVAGSLVTLHCPLGEGSGPFVEGDESNDSETSDSEASRGSASGRKDSRRKSGYSTRKAIRACFDEIAQSWASILGLVDPFQGGITLGSLYRAGRAEGWMRQQSAGRDALFSQPTEGDAREMLGQGQEETQHADWHAEDEEEASSEWCGVEDTSVQAMLRLWHVWRRLEHIAN